MPTVLPQPKASSIRCVCLLLLANPGESRDVPVENDRGVDVPTSCRRVARRVECLAVIPAKVAEGDVAFHDQMRCAILSTPISSESVDLFDLAPQAFLSDLVLRPQRIVITEPEQNEILTVRTDAPSGITTVSYIIPADELASGRSRCHEY